MPYFNGKVKTIGIFECSEAQKNSIPDNITHNIAVILEGGPETFTNVRTAEKKEAYDLTWDLKVGDNYVTVLENAVIEFMYEVRTWADKKTGETKTGWNIDKKTIKLVENGNVPPKSYTYHKAKGSAPSGGSATASVPYDNKGMIKGNAFNSAMIIVGYDTNNPNIVEIAKQIYNINNELGAEMPNVNRASIGMSILNACHITKDVKKVKSMAVSLLNSYIQDIDKWVEGGAIMESPTPEHKKNKPQPTPEILDDDLPF